MKQVQEQKCYRCKFCGRSFSNGRKLGGHMRCHLALISASRKKGNHDSINGERGLDGFDYDGNGRKQGIQELSNSENGIDFDDDDDQIVKKSQRIEQDYDVNGRKQGIQENNRELSNGEKCIDFDDDRNEIVKKSQRIEQDYDANSRKQGIQESDEEVVNGDFKCVDQDYGTNVYVLRENPKKSWRFSNSSKDYGNFCVKCGKGFHSSKEVASHKRCHSRKLSIKNNVCEKCSKSFESVKALYGHMRYHSIKRSKPLNESTAISSSNEHDDDDDDEVANPVRKKRSCTRYKSPKPSLSSFNDNDDDDDDVEEGAICLMMLSRGVRELEGVKLVISDPHEKNVEFEVSVNNGSMKFYKFKKKNDMGLKKDLIFGSGSGLVNPGRAHKSTKKPRLCDQDLEDHKCPVCFKAFGSGQALGSHKRVHKKPVCKAIESSERGISNGDVEFNLTWVHSDIEWNPLAMRFSTCEFSSSEQSNPWATCGCNSPSTESSRVNLRDHFYVCLENE